MTDAQPPAFDALRLIADVRKGDPQALVQAYKATFGHALGRLVLAHFMAECGVGNSLGAQLSAGELRYAAGRHDAAIMLAQSAGFDQAAAVVAVLSDNLEGSEDEPASYYPPLGDDEF